jgi:hypothetical protein
MGQFPAYCCSFVVVLWVLPFFLPHFLQSAAVVIKSNTKVGGKLTEISGPTLCTSCHLLSLLLLLLSLLLLLLFIYLLLFDWALFLLHH